MKPKQSPMLRKVFLYVSILCVMAFWFTSTIATGRGSSDSIGNNSDVSQYSLRGTYTGCIKESRGDGEAQFTIVIASDTAKHPTYGTVWHHIGGTVTLSGFSSCIIQASFSPEMAGKNSGFWREVDFFGLIAAKGENFSKVTMAFLISPDLKHIKVTAGNFKIGTFDCKCRLMLYDAILTKQE